MPSIAVVMFLLTLVAAEPPSWSDPMATLGVSLRLPSVWKPLLANMVPLHNRVEMSFGYSGQRYKFLTLIAADLDGRSVQQVAEAANDDPIIDRSTRIDSHAQRGCNGTQNGWLLTRSNGYTTWYVVAVASSARIAIAKFGGAKPEPDLVKTIETMCVDEAEPPRWRTAIEQLHDHGIDIQIPAGWLLFRNVATSSSLINTSVYAPPGTRDDGPFTALEIEGTTLKGTSLRELVAEQEKERPGTTFAPIRVCNGTQQAMQGILDTEGERARVTFVAATSGYAASIVYVHDKSQRDDPAAIYTLDTLCAK